MHRIFNGNMLFLANSKNFPESLGTRLFSGCFTLFNHFYIQYVVYVLTYVSCKVQQMTQAI